MYSRPLPLILAPAPILTLLNPLRSRNKRQDIDPVVFNEHVGMKKRILNCLSLFAGLPLAVPLIMDPNAGIMRKLKEYVEGWRRGGGGYDWAAGADTRHSHIVNILIVTPHIYPGSILPLPQVLRSRHGRGRVGVVTGRGRLPLRSCGQATDNSHFRHHRIHLSTVS